MSEIVVLDADQVTRSVMARTLAAAEFAVLECGDGPEALRHIFSRRPSALVMDLQVAGFNGLELIRMLRAASDLPIIVAGAGEAHRAAVRVLDMGADDYLEKPVQPPELTARVRAAIRRWRRLSITNDPAEASLVRTGPLTINREAQIVTKRGEPVRLTRIETLLLDALAARVGRVAPHRYLLSTVWGEQYIDDTHYVRGYIGSLRNKLEDDPTEPRLLVNEWGMGYRLAILPPEPERDAAAQGEVASYVSEAAAVAPSESAVA